MPVDDRWSKLSMRDRADLIKIYTKHGVTDLNEIRRHYNSFQDPVFEDRSKPKADLYNRLVDEKDNRSIKIGDGIGTHLMSWATVDDKPVGYSQIQPDNNGNLKDYGDKALDRAIERGDTIQFRDEKDVDWWTSNNYKQFYKKMAPAYDEYRRDKLKEKYPFYNTDVMNIKANGGHLFAYGSPDHDPNNPYHYHTPEGEKVVITPEEWEANKGKPYFKEVEAAVNAERAAHPGPEYEIDQNYVNRLNRDYGSRIGSTNGAYNFRGYASQLPEGYTISDQGVIYDNEGNAYVQDWFTHRDYPYDVNNPITFTFNKGKGSERNEEFYPVNMQKRVKDPFPVDRIMNVEQEKTKAIEKYIADNSNSEPIYYFDIFRNPSDVLKMERDKVLGFDFVVNNGCSEIYPELVRRGVIADYKEIPLPNLEKSHNHLVGVTKNQIEKYHLQENIKNAKEQQAHVNDENIIPQYRGATTYLEGTRKTQPSRKEVEKNAIIEILPLQYVNSSYANGGHLYQSGGSRNNPPKRISSLLDPDKVRNRLPADASKYLGLDPFGITNTITAGLQYIFNNDNTVQDKLNERYELLHKTDDDWKAYHEKLKKSGHNVVDWETTKRRLLDLANDYIGLEDAKDIYLNTSQRSNTFYPSKERPTIGNIENVWASNYLSSPTVVEDYILPAIRNIRTKNTVKNAQGAPLGSIEKIGKSGKNGVSFLPILGHATVGYGTDPYRGSYVSYYDKWDVNMSGKKGGTDVVKYILGGTPVNIYDRIYLDDYYGYNSVNDYKNSKKEDPDITYGGWLPEVDISASVKSDGGHLFQVGGYKEIPPYLPQGYFPEIVSRNESAKLYSNDTDTREKAVNNIVNRANKKAEAKKVVERFDPEIVEQNNIDGLNTWATLAGLRGADFVFNPWVNQGIKAAAKPILGGAKRLTSKYVYPVINELGSGLKNGIKTEFIEGLNEMLRPIGSGIDKFANSKAGNKLIRNYYTRDRLDFISRTLNSNLPFSEKIESMYRPEIAAGYRTIDDRIYFDDDFYDKTGYILRDENPFDINHLMYTNLTSKGAVDKATKDLTRIPIGGRVLLNYSHALSTDSYPLLLNIMKSNTSIMPKGRKFKVTPTKRLGKQKMIELNAMGRASDLLNYHLKNIDGIEYTINGRPLGYLGENYVARTFGKEEAKRSKEALYKEYEEGILKAVKRINKKIDDLNKDRGLSLPHAEFDNQQDKIWVPAVQAKRTRANGGNLGHITSYGQWQYPHQITTIPSNNITMQGVDYPVIGISDTGDKKLMLPGLDYIYDGNYVTEYPLSNKK